MKDTIKTRLMAIESITSVEGFDLECLVGFGDHKKLTKKELIKRLEEAVDIIGDCTLISHGGLSKCCKGGSFNKLEPAIKAYYGEKKVALLSHKKDPID